MHSEWKMMLLILAIGIGLPVAFTYVYLNFDRLSIVNGSQSSVKIENGDPSRTQEPDLPELSSDSLNSAISESFGAQISQLQASIEKVEKSLADVQDTMTALSQARDSLDKQIQEIKESVNRNYLAIKGLKSTATSRKK
jgi:peptidoglycan hydrolase CwlO-like protein